MAAKLFSWPSLFASADEQVMRRVKANDDPQAFAQLMERWQGPIQGLCTRMIGDPHRGEDLTQEVFARLYARRRGYEPTGKFSTFLWRIALNICYDEIRKTKRRRELSLDEPDDDNLTVEFEAAGTLPDQRMVEDERADAVRRALVELAEPYRVVVVLRHYEGLKFREIAEVLGIPEGTVKSRMTEALSQLGVTLSSFFSETPEPPKPVRRANEQLLI